MKALSGSYEIAAVDAQVHLWRVAPEFKITTATADLLREHGGTSLEPEVLIGRMDDVGVARAVIVPPSVLGDSNDYALETAKAFPERFAVMGRLSLTDPGRWRDSLGEWTAQPGMLGIRLTFHSSPANEWLTDGTVDWIWGAAEHYQIWPSLNKARISPYGFAIGRCSKS
jgi:predicted TIM-barrel fold metal-dependent hydrolase